MNDCLFCKIIAGRVPSYIVYEDNYAKAFLDIAPSSPGHTMVIPKKHGDKIGEFSPEELGQVMDTVKKVAGALEKAFDTSILSIGINHGEPSGVHHLHVHVIPRFPGDGGGVMQSLVQKKTEHKLEEIQNKIRGCFQ